MKVLATFVISALISLLSGCGRADTMPPNVLSVSAPGSPPCNYVDVPCASVTLCSPGTGNCQTIPDILIDTGSSGLRVFNSALSLNLPYVTDSSGNLIGDCAVYADGTAEWGPVVYAGVILGNEPAVTVPVQVIDSTFANSAGISACGTTSIADSTTWAGPNGVLGVGFFQYDGGPYYACTSPSCSAIRSLPNVGIVQNPVFLLPVDNNGAILSFPAVPDNGSPSVTGTLTLGIGTEANNQAGGGISLYAASPAGALTAVFGSTTYANSVIDSGTDGLGIPSDTGNPYLASCTAPYAAYLCLVNSPTTAVSLTVSILSSNRGYQPVTLNIQDMSALLANNPYNGAFNDIAFYSPSGWGGFFFGFPFFLGRTIYFGYDQQATPLGTGPYYAY